MATCCAPNNVTLANNCYYWCALPEACSNGDGFGSCLTNRGIAQGIAGNHVNGVGDVVNANPALVGLWVLLVAKLLFLS